MLTFLEYKPTFTDSNGDLAIDLTAKTLKYEYGPQVVDAIIVDEFTAMRPDLISEDAYAEYEYWDLILKFNGISNPLSIDVNDILYIPEISQMAEQFKYVLNTEDDLDSVRAQYTDPTKVSAQDPGVVSAIKKRLDAIKALGQGYNNASASNLPPNIAEQGDKEISVRGGKIYFGPNVTKNKEECQAPVSKSDFINKLISIRLNGK